MTQITQQLETANAAAGVIGQELVRSAFTGDRHEVHMAECAALNARKYEVISSARKLQDVVGVAFEDAENGAEEPKFHGCIARAMHAAIRAAR